MKEDVLLDVTKQARERILVGLNWSPKNLTLQEKAGQIIRGAADILQGSVTLVAHNLNKIGEKSDGPRREDFDPNFDLDLCCYAYDRANNFISLVDPDAWNAIDENGKIYHSGDNMTGLSGNDDEQIYIELKGLPDDYQNFFFIILSDCKHDLGKIPDATIRISDSFSNRDFLKAGIGRGSGSGKFACVFCRIYKKDGNWYAREIGEYIDFEQDWPEYLKKYI